MVFCSAAALVGVIAVGASTTADFYNRHPDFSTQVAGNVCRAATEYNVVYRAGQLVAQQVEKVAARPAASAEPCHGETVTAPADPQPVGTSASEKQPCQRKSIPICGVLELIKVEARPHKCEEEPQAEPPVCPSGHEEVNGELVPPLPADPVCEEKRDAGDAPHCPAPQGLVVPAHCAASDADAKDIPSGAADGVDAPAVMPYIADASEAIPLMPREEASAEPAKDEGLSDCEGVFQFWVGFFRKAIGEEEGDTHEQSEKVKDGMPPDCQEDPARDHQYPGCPYSGGCPYGGSCPSGPCINPSTKPQPEEETPKAGEETQETVPPSPAPEHKPANVPPYAGSEDVPSHPEVDTTEFRPREDARRGEFDPAPF
jgi:hypothetical protein